MENRNGLIVGAVPTRASGHAERLATLAVIEPHAHSRCLTRSAPTTGTTPCDFVMELRDKAVAPHVTQDQSGGRSAIDRRTTRHPGYAVSQLKFAVFQHSGSDVRCAVTGTEGGNLERTRLRNSTHPGRMTGLGGPLGLSIRGMPVPRLGRWIR
jgi:hypothetical protein